MLDQLPTELVIEILQWTTAVHYGDKNALLELRKVCKLFNEILTPISFSTLPMDYTRVHPNQVASRPALKLNALHRIAPFVRSLFIDMMVLRDDNECHFLEHAFAEIPKMKEWVSNLRESYCMNEDAFTPQEYRDSLQTMLSYAPSTTAVKLNLPFQMVACGQFRTSTLLLGNTFDLLAHRPEGSESLQTLSLDNLSDLSIAHLWSNPSDVSNIIKTFEDLRHLSLSVRGHWVWLAPIGYAHRVWEMICKATKLESLCLIDLDVGEVTRSGKLINSKVRNTENTVPAEWEYRSFPSIAPEFMFFSLPNLTYLELRNVNVKAKALAKIFANLAKSLRELYLDNVYLKTKYCIDWPYDKNYRDLWIGHCNVRPGPGQHWLAIYLRQLRTKLRVCRVSNLGYDRFILRGIIEAPVTVKYDFFDPSGLDRTLEQRFVEVVMGYEQPDAPDGSPVIYYPQKEHQDAWAMADLKRPKEVAAEDWDASLHSLRKRHPTSNLQKSIDDTFASCNPWTVKTLHSFADRTSEGIKELTRMREERQANEEAQENQESQD
ncbi:hypothetical protein F4805DRAFT_417217 [Annulohypoxylon moriforme]|nr:hypothetical protein F4805DRAFT_417217 [Annulohypoxylon moriforme]